MKDNLRELISEAIVLMQGVDEGTLSEDEKEKRVARLLLEVLKFVAGPGGRDAGGKAKAQRKQTQPEKSDSRSWSTVKVRTRQPAPLPEQTERQQKTGSDLPYQYPQWHIHGAWAGTLMTIPFNDSVNPNNNYSSGLVLVRSPSDWEALRQTKTRGQWGAISSRSLNKYSRRVALPVMKKCGACEVRNLYYTHVTGDDISASAPAPSAPKPDPVIFVQDWNKPNEAELRKKVTEILQKTDTKGSVFGFKKSEIHTSLAVRIPADKVNDLLEINNKEPSINQPKSVFVRNPSWSNGDDTWPVMAFQSELGFVAAKAKTGVLSDVEGASGKYYFCRFKSGLGLRVHPDVVKDVRAKLGASLKPALPSGDRYVIKSSAIRKFTTKQISEFLADKHEWKHTVVATFQKGSTTTLIAIAESRPPNFVCIGTNTYLVINKETKKSDRPPPLGPVYRPGEPQQVVTDQRVEQHKRRKTDQEDMECDDQIIDQYRN
eukprot:TRINITY_DN1157_c0_g1_i6.p1 TRINITY_DN1157_c0_g1~~TRINITY_DN1157_c0_g1_i6.p1  ORF type:complete len:488 (+),score=44.40 TRINITY_DN1157_c0_g1_i6:154-1617(+)